MNIDTPYYEDLFRISNSNIGWFLNKGPAFLHKMLTDPPPEEKNSTLERGTMIHEYILQPEEFQKDYVVWDKSRPSSAQQEKFCQELANSLEIEPNKALLSAYRNAYSTSGKTEEKMLSEASKIASTLKEYIDFLKSDDKRKMISPWDAKMLNIIRTNMIEHKMAQQIVWPVIWDNDKQNVGKDGTRCYHEFHINWEYLAPYGSNAEQDENPQGVYGIKCKSLLDGLTLDFKNNKAIIYDLKTTQKLWHFEDSMNMYDYCRQLAYYTMAVIWYLEEECGVYDAENTWTFEYYIIGIDTTGSNDVRVFHIDSKNVHERDDTIDEAMKDIAWHQMNDKWDHTRAYYEGDGSETLNL